MKRISSAVILAAAALASVPAEAGQTDALEARVTERIIAITGTIIEDRQLSSQCKIILTEFAPAAIAGTFKREEHADEATAVASAYLKAKCPYGPLLWTSFAAQELYGQIVEAVRKRSD